MEKEIRTDRTKGKSITIAGSLVTRGIEVQIEEAAVRISFSGRVT
jgi:hypothetical protein